MATAPNIPYNFDYIVDYSTFPDSNRLYRKCIRELFYMSSEITPEMDGLDEETIDELLYDEITVNTVLGLLYSATCNDPLFQQLYDLGAGAFFSTDRTIGQVVLLSFDYLTYFHPCLQDFFREPGLWNHGNIHYLTLKNKLS